MVGGIFAHWDILKIGWPHLAQNNLISCHPGAVMPFYWGEGRGRQRIVSNDCRFCLGVRKNGATASAVWPCQLLRRRCWASMMNRIRRTGALSCSFSAEWTTLFSQFSRCCSAWPLSWKQVGCSLVVGTVASYARACNGSVIRCVVLFESTGRKCIQYLRFYDSQIHLFLDWDVDFPIRSDLLVKILTIDRSRSDNPWNGSQRRVCPT